MRQFLRVAKLIFASILVLSGAAISFVCIVYTQNVIQLDLSNYLTLIGGMGILSGLAFAVIGIYMFHRDMEHANHENEWSRRHS